MPPIYIAYRTGDADIVERIAQAIIVSFGAHTLQMNPTLDWPSNLKLDYHIESMMYGSDTILIVIGKEWAGLDEYGRFRLSSADIPLYNELKIALRMEKKRIVVLIDGAKLPPIHQVPEEFHGLYDLPVVQLRPKSFQADLRQFVAPPTVCDWLKYWFLGLWRKRRTIGKPS